MSRNIILELFNHGLSTDPTAPCGEVEIFSVSGSYIPKCLLKLLTSECSFDSKFDWFSHLPTERCLIVEAVAEDEDDSDWWLDVKSWECC